VTRAVVSASIVVPSEKDEQREIVRLYETLGCEIVSFSQPRATMQTEGIPDLKVYCRRKRLTWWHEAKAAGGMQSKAQVAFEARARACGEHYVLGGWLAAVVAVRAFGLVPPDWKPVEEL
jgi:hypothetical protein